ncbi:MAG: crossover junction endodeoxyribonuclease RuvC [Clostridiales bacterium]|nr:crossover junction endodeoxyribonuclease RuvC [Clostridiales bacterium]
MKILGIDPGFAITGYSVITYEGNKFKLIESGAVNTSKDMPFEDRLACIYDKVTDLIKEYSPDYISVEELFFNNNVTTAIGVAQGRGAVLIAASKNKVPIFEYTPLQVKQAVVGYGRADKKQVSQMVKAILNLDAVPKLDDITDSMAVGICHAHSYNVLSRGLK